MSPRRLSFLVLIALVLWICIALGSPARSLAAPQWEERQVTGPSARCEFGFAYDSQREVSVLFGGSSDLTFAAVNRETWEWDGMQWSLRATNGPSARCDNAFAYDAARGRVVSFGGYNGNYLGDTWEWDGAAWNQVVTPGPSARADAFMVFDSARNVMVLFGGQASNGTLQRDTWEYDGVAWTLRATTGPSRRWIQRMAFDRDRGVTVMYGGGMPSAALNDTWEWNGTTWTQVIVTGPDARFANALCYDTDRHLTVLFGGQTGVNFGENPLGDTWEYDGVAWSERVMFGPPPRTFVKMVYDEARRRAVLFGGWADVPLGDTWELTDYQPTAVGSADRVGFALHGFRPNPAAGELRVSFALPESTPARLEVLDLGGRRVMERRWTTPRPGAHVVSLGPATRLRAGTYWLRLTQGRRVTSVRGVVLGG